MSGLFLRQRELSAKGFAAMSVIVMDASRPPQRGFFARQQCYLGSGDGFGPTIGEDVRADLRLCRILIGEGCHRHPAFGAECGRLLRQRAKRQEEAAALAARQARIDERIDIGGEADRRLGADSIAAAPADFA